MNSKSPKDTSWGKVAEWYDELIEQEGGTYQKDLILPNLSRLLAPQKGEIILDIACGQGFFAREWHKAGATVVASDIAGELIEKAKTQSPGTISYYVSPSHLMPFVKSASADKATIVLALQNIEKVTETLVEAASKLKTGGKLYIVLNHPAFRIPKHSSWQWDEANKLQFRRIDSYMRETRQEIIMNPGERDQSQRKTTITFHRPLQVYFKAFSKAGFGITKLEEWVSHKKSSDGPRSKEEDRTRGEIPMFVCLECTKM